ncbi:MAG: molybdopterin-dependent oxidoreductase [Candidatus Nitrospinota bacterium M3_3B_026]
MIETAAPTDITGSVTLTINGASVEVPAGTTILNAATKMGVYIPTFCYLKKLLPIGSCRVCSVEVEGVDGPVMSCATPAADGMAVTTESEQLARYRQQMMRFILVNHPLDCPVCERSGECSLQDMTFELGVTNQIFATAERTRVPLADWNVLRYDKNLCVMCERCVKICREIQGVAALEFDGAGYAARVKPVGSETLDCDFCGQCLSVCPVGAISSAIVLPVRSWEVEKVRTVCPHCAVGCSYHVNVKNGLIARITSGDDIGINTGNLCARGRFGFEAFSAEGRLTKPLVRKNMKHEPVSWDEAVKTVVDRLNETVKKHGPDSVAVLASERITNEDAYLLQKVFREGFKVERLDTMSNMRAPELNSGLFETFGASAPIISYERIEKAGSFFFFGLDAARENPVIANMVRMAMRDHGTPLYVADSRETGFQPNELLRLRYEYGTEAALAAALIRLMAEGEGAIDPASAADGVDDPSLLVKTAGAVDPKEAAETTGVPLEKIEAAARGMAERGAPLVFIGKQIHDHPKGLEIVKALSNLARLAGGEALLYREYCNTQGVTDMGVAPSRLPGYEKGGSQPAAGRDIFHDLAEGTLKALVVAGADPTVHYPDGEFIREAIQAAEFVAVTESFMTETAGLADVILPACVQPERDGTYTNNEGRPQLVRKAVEPKGESKPEWEIFQAMAQAAGMDISYASAAQITGEIAQKVPGYTDVAEGGAGRVSYPGARGKGRAFEFDPSPLQIKKDGAYPYLALIGNSLFHLDGLSRESEALNGIEPAAFVEINPEDAGAEGLKDGDAVTVESRQGSIKAVAAVTGKSPKGTVFMPKSFEDAPAYRLVYRGDAATFVRIKKADG